MHECRPLCLVLHYWSLSAVMLFNKVLPKEFWSAFLALNVSLFFIFDTQSFPIKDGPCGCSSRTLASCFARVSRTNLRHAHNHCKLHPTAACGKGNLLSQWWNGITIHTDTNTQLTGYFKKVEQLPFKCLNVSLGYFQPFPLFWRLTVIQPHSKKVGTLYKM